MHIVNPTITNRYKKLDKWFKSALLLGGLVTFAALVLTKTDGEFRDSAYGYLMKWGLIKADSAFFQSPAAAYATTAFLLVWCALLAVMMFHLLFSSWRHQANLDEHHTKLYSEIMGIFEKAESTKASMSTIRWCVHVEQVIRLGESVIEVKVKRLNKGLEFWPLAEDTLFYIDERGFSAKKGLLSSLQLLAINRLLIYVHTYYIYKQIDEARIALKAHRL